MERQGSSVETPKHPNQCNCGREEVYYYCKDTSCQNHTQQQLYCIPCFEEGKHQHFPLCHVPTKIQEISENWDKLIVDFGQVITDSEREYALNEPLIKYLEKEMISVQIAQANPVKWISKSIDAMKSMNSDLKKEHEQVQELIKTNCAVALIEKERSYLKYFEALQQSQKIDEDAIFEQYYSALASDQNTPFTHFNQDHRDAYFRLKFRAINSRIQPAKVELIKEVIDETPGIEDSKEPQSFTANGFFENLISSLDNKIQLLSHQNAKYDKIIESISIGVVEHSKNFDRQESITLYTHQYSQLIEKVTSQLKEEMKALENDVYSVVRLPPMIKMRMQYEGNYKQIHFQDSRILQTDSQVKWTIDSIFGFKDTSSVSLLYRGSRDGWHARFFHVLCDDKGPTVSLVLTTKGHIAGGYASVSWNSMHAVHVPDGNACVFEVQNKVRYECLTKPYALYHNPNHAFNFGGGCLAIESSPLNGQNAGMCRRAGQHEQGDYYKIPVNSSGNQVLTGDGKDTNGKFTCVELEVYAVHL